METIVSSSNWNVDWSMVGEETGICNLNNQVPVKDEVNYGKNLITEIFKESGTRTTETCTIWCFCVCDGS